MIKYIVVFIDVETNTTNRVSIVAYDKLSAWNTLAITTNREIVLVDVYKNPCQK